MTKLNQIIALEKGVKARASRELEELRASTQKDALLAGISRTYQPRDEDGDPLPPEGTKVQVRVEEVLARVSAVLTRLFDVVATKDIANGSARADVVVDGETLLRDVPVAYLLFLEKQLADLQSFLAKLPVLDPAEDWSWDSAAGVYRTPTTKTVRSRKVPKVLVKYEATEHHPAQTEVFTVDEPVGDWSTVKFSGALPAERRGQLLDRVIALGEAVKVAREAANQFDVTDQAYGKLVFDYLFAR
ncbi:hypothetical protein I6A84_06280 [Frankia sp. CNm7]|uniref:Uncharacterized protein n=1 Tax=Frankia nepalensis TaxID=1836974 RepID=A0A937RR60_9ACTN|nr:hypothetical protein [Frankia nepalensis]MBL7497492.1 hypothetical protein [Frankia nepalensis]MBL7509567.1 hypothetical protein [Frankia nepalensis]MBL7517741.1 hypothetical protein [Frankia nepalensis]MBL7633394.1 hypothetical protein [Frankia nepalensis]